MGEPAYKAQSWGDTDHTMKAWHKFRPPPELGSGVCFLLSYTPAWYAILITGIWWYDLVYAGVDTKKHLVLSMSSNSRIRRRWTESEDQMLRSEAEIQRTATCPREFFRRLYEWLMRKNSETGSTQGLEPDRGETAWQNEQGLPETMEQGVRARDKRSPGQCRGSAIAERGSTL